MLQICNPHKESNFIWDFNLPNSSLGEVQTAYAFQHLIERTDTEVFVLTKLQRILPPSSVPILNRGLKNWLDICNFQSWASRMNVGF